MEQKEKTFFEMVIKFHPTGSRYICNPPPQDTDNDTIFLVNGYYDWETTLYQEGWVRDGNYDLDVYDFVSVRKGDENYIVTENPAYYQAFVMATNGAKALNLLKKEDRIALFHALLDEEFIRENGFAIDGGIPNFENLEPVPF